MSADATFVDWMGWERAAEASVPLIGSLYRDQGVVTMVNGVSLVHQSPTDIVMAHRRGHTMNGHDLDVGVTLKALEVLVTLPLQMVELDLGQLLADFAAAADPGSVETYLRARCADILRSESETGRVSRDVVLYGFGRIGRILARLMVAKAGGGDKYRLRAIVVRKKAEDDLERRANLLRRDSIHGAFEGTVRVLKDDNALLINGSKVLVLYSNAPHEVDYASHGIRDAIVIDNTGKWRTKEDLSRHLEAPGASDVILTAPGKGGVPNIVYGINEGEMTEEHHVLSAASCTTNAIVPVLKAMHDAYEIRSGHIETVHAFTNDQNLIDNYHKKERRGRSAALNLVITTTGAASAVAKALPELGGRLTGSAIRVPTPNVSLAILNLVLAKSVTRDEINQYLRGVATTSALSAQIGWTSMPDTVSTDLVGNTHAGVVDSQATIETEEGAVLYVWYDNEYGYSCQVMRMMERLCGLQRRVFP